MIRILLIAVLSVVFFSAEGIYSFSKADTSFSYRYYDYDVNISSSASEFFNGRLSISSNGKVLFSMDSTFTDYVDHKFIDLNGDGSKEMLLYLTEGASPYIFHNLFIFDHKLSPKPLFILQNGEADTSIAEKPLLTVNLRQSPAILGLWYSWYLEYSDGKLMFIRPDKQRNAMLEPDYKNIKLNLDELSRENQICDDFAYNVFFEHIFITAKISGTESKAERFFEENYKCKNKTEALIQMKNAAADTYSWIKDSENYKYFEY